MPLNDVRRVKSPIM